LDNYILPYHLHAEEYQCRFYNDTKGFLYCGQNIAFYPAAVYHYDDYTDPVPNSGTGPSVTRF